MIRYVQGLDGLVSFLAVVQAKDVNDFAIVQAIKKAKDDQDGHIDPNDMVMILEQG